VIIGITATDDVGLLDLMGLPALLARTRDRLGNVAQSDPLLADLSCREYQILAAIVEGHSNREIAIELDLAEKTVKNYVSNVFVRLAVHNRNATAIYAVQHAPHEQRMIVWVGPRAIGCARPSRGQTSRHGPAPRSEWGPSPVGSIWRPDSSSSCRTMASPADGDSTEPDQSSIHPDHHCRASMAHLCQTATRQASVLATGLSINASLHAVSRKGVSCR